MKFSKIFEPSKMSLLCILLNVMSYAKWASIASTSSNPDAALPIVCRFTQPCVTCFSLAHKIDATKETRRGTCQNFDRDARPIFFRFEIWPNPIFLGWQIFQLFFWVSQNFRYFLGLTNFQLFFGSSYFCITHLNPLNE